VIDITGNTVDVQCRMKNIAKTSLALYRRPSPFNYNKQSSSCPSTRYPTHTGDSWFFHSYFFQGADMYIYIITASIPMPNQIRHRLVPSGSHKDRIPFQLMVEGDTSSSNVSQIRKSCKHMVEGDVPHSIRVEIEKGKQYSGKKGLQVS